MPRTRKSTEGSDCNTGKGKKRISAIRNRGADRAVDYLKKFQKSSKHIVLVNLIPTWPNGKPRVWHSHPVESFTPLKKDCHGKIVPFVDSQVKFFIVTAQQQPQPQQQNNHNCSWVETK